MAALMAAKGVGARKPEMAMALPDVESVLTKATGKAHDFAEQASAMQAKVALQQQKSRDALAAQKASYEKKLSQQAAQSDAIKANNTLITSHNDALKKANADLESELRDLQSNNAKMRQSLKTIDDKVSAAELFLQDSLKVTDDSDAEVLSVLAPTTPKPTLDHFLAVAGAEQLSLLQLSSTGSRSQGPEDLVNVLSKSLADIASAEVEGAAELKAHFLANFEEGQRQQAALNATQVQLMELQSELKDRQAKLLEAKGRLQSTSKELTGRLHGLRIFARKVDSAAAGSLATKPATQEKVEPAPAATTQAPAQAAPVEVAKSAVVAVATPQKLETLKKPVAPQASATQSPKAPAAPKQTAALRQKVEAPKSAAVVAEQAAKGSSKVQHAAPHAVKESSALATKAPHPATMHPKKQVGLMQASAAQKKTATRPPKKHLGLMQSPAVQKTRKVEEPSQWKKWLSVLR